MRICFFGTFDAQRHPRVAVIEDGLRAHGFEVARCNVPWSAGTADRVQAIRAPFTAIRMVRRLIRSWRGLRQRARHLPDAEVVIVGYLGVLDIHLARHLFPQSLIVLDHLAPVEGILDDRRFGRSARLLGRLLDHGAERRADLVVADTFEHAEGMGRDRSVVVPVGAQDSWFAPGLGPDDPVPLRVIFYGLFTPLQGAPAIAEALTLALDAGVRLQVSMVGKGQDLATCREVLGDRPDVTWDDWVEPAVLPHLVGSHHVCLGIFGVTAKAARVVPNKVYQGAAAGCAIVTSDTRPQRRALGSAGVFVPAGDAPALATVLAELAGDPVRVAQLRAAARDLADTSFRPTKVVEPLSQRLRAATAHG